MKPIGARRTKYLLPAPGGYLKVYSPRHPNAQKRGYVLQHVLVMSAILGRSLLPEETVHHKNGDRTDNRPDNLELWSHAQPKGQRVEDKVAWAIDLLNTYKPESLHGMGA